MTNETTQGSWWERLNIKIFNFMIAVLPYLTPLPIAWMTADSASEFLGLNPYVSGVLVFALEGLGLLCTSLLIDAVVAWIRSRSWKTFVPVIIFTGIVIAYVRILVTLNVTLETNSGNLNPALAEVITLLCYFPLISGAVNGWNKLRVENRNKEDEARRRDEETAERHRNQQIEVTQQENEARRKLELEKLRIQEEAKTERAKVKVALASQPVPVVNQQAVTTSELPASHYAKEIEQLLMDTYKDIGKVLKVKEIADHFNLNYDRNKGYISAKRKAWMTINNLETDKKR